MFPRVDAICPYLEPQQNPQATTYQRPTGTGGIRNIHHWMHGINNVTLMTLDCSIQATSSAHWTCSVSRAMLHKAAAAWGTRKHLRTSGSSSDSGKAAVKKINRDVYLWMYCIPSRIFDGGWRQGATGAKVQLASPVPAHTMCGFFTPLCP